MIRILDYDNFSDECDFLINSLDIELICYGMYDEKYNSRPFVIDSFLASNIVKAKEDICFSIKKDSYYAYEINAQIVDLATKKVLPITLLFDHRIGGFGDVMPFIKRLDEVFAEPEMIREW